MIVIFLGFVFEVRRNIHVNQVALIGLCAIYDTDDPDELSLDVP